MDVLAAVQNRYSAAAKTVEPSLCIPVKYDRKYLQAIPDEVLDTDYGCGDPSPYVKEGDVVLDLGSGAGKLCFIASQIVGPRGSVIGVDRNQSMLEVARRNAPIVAAKTGHANVRFACGSIEDLALDLEALVSWVQQHPIRSADDVLALEAEKARMRRAEPLIPSDSVDAVVSNCVLNLVPSADRLALFRELYRVVRVGGRVAISDIVCDDDVPADMQQDPALWSDCISGAFREDRFLAAFEQAGFYGVRLVKYEARPWRTVRDIEFRSVTVLAYKGKSETCSEGYHAVLYRGPWKEVVDDDGHRFRRGDRVAVCSESFRLLSSEPYSTDVVPLPPRYPVSVVDMPPFLAAADYRLRTVKETKAIRGNATPLLADPSAAIVAAPCCTPTI